jgi:hypothetical protein
MLNKYEIMEKIMYICEKCTGVAIWTILISGSFFLWYLIYILVIN